MVYFTSTMDRDEILQLIRQVDINAFCLWQDEKGKNLYGVIKDSAYEFFIVACSLFAVQHMKYLTPEQIAQTFTQNEQMIICGNRSLME